MEYQPLRVLLVEDDNDDDGALDTILKQIGEPGTRGSREQDFVHLALHDSLTELPNRILLLDRLRQAIERARRHAESRFAVLYLDFDHFKRVNDTLGHLAGDALLVAIARRLEWCVRAEDTVARLGGDEFAILLDHVADASDATRVADRIHEALTAPVTMGGGEISTTASIGIALSVTSNEGPEDLLRAADSAMYAAKGRGRGCTAIFDARMHADALSQAQMEADLRRAIHAGELRLSFQPITALGSGRLVGFEALVRWQHPARGLLTPEAFMAIAEETGLVVPLDYWVLREACRTMRGWQERMIAAEPLTISVNLSAKHFGRDDLATTVREVLRETGLDPRRLKIEITERALIEHEETTVATLKALRAIGVQVQIDDFGTGYSSLIYLRRFPIDTLKLDRAFATGRDLTSEEIVRATVALSHNLKIDVIAEGVETEAQVRRLHDLGCDFAQGYVISPPVAREEIMALLGTMAGEAAGAA